VSTFGLADEKFGACRQDWTRRWAPLADRAEVIVSGR
jgi:hypothetical protein